MNVDIDNFSEARSKIEQLKLIERCQCVSFDLEFTGVRFENGDREKSQQLPFQRYRKMKNVVNKYNIIQLGTTFFTHQEGEVIAYPFNFYLFPRQNSLRDPVISMQGNTVEFNSAQGMDWNRWIRKGITYVKISEMNQLVSKQKNSRTFEEMMETADQTVIQNVQKIISEGTALSPMKKQKQMQIPKICSNFIKKILDKFCEDKNFLMKYSDYQDSVSDYASIVVDYVSIQEKKAISKKQTDAILGFTSIFKLLWQKQVTFVGHNCLFDLLYIYESFVGPLPDNYMEFKQQLRKNGRKFYDTKVLSNQFENRNQTFQNGTTLEQIHKYFATREKELIKTLEVKVAKGFEMYDLNKPVLHEAGFDGFLTGWIFYQMMKKFPNYDNFQGKINLYKSYFQMNIHKSDTIVEDSQIFVIVVFAPTQFVQREQIWKKKEQMNREIKTAFREENIMQYLQIHDGFKEIYLEVRDKKNSKAIAVKLINLLEKRVIPNIHTLSHFVEMRGKQMETDKIQI